MGLTRKVSPSLSYPAPRFFSFSSPTWDTRIFWFFLGWIKHMGMWCELDILKKFFPLSPLY
jgi:hypothetical protein